MTTPKIKRYTSKDVDWSIQNEWYDCEELDAYIEPMLAVVEAAMQLDDCLCEFDGELSVCGEWYDAFLDKVTKFKEAQRNADKKN